MNNGKQRYYYDKWQIGNKIRIARETKGMSQEELAYGIGLADQRSIYYYETGDKLPKLERIIEICNILDISIDGLLSN